MDSIFSALADPCFYLYVCDPERDFACICSQMYVLMHVCISRELVNATVSSLTGAKRLFKA